jgi:hypothetical protein
MAVPLAANSIDEFIDEFVDHLFLPSLTEVLE